MATFFVTGTDTGVGKTTVTRALCAYYSIKRKVNVGVMKPFETGVTADAKESPPRDAAMLKEASGSGDDLGLINPYVFKTPVAPATAASLEEVDIDLDRLDGIYDRLSDQHDVLFIEGAGGVLVPIKEDFFFSDLMKRWKTSVLVVSRLGLGTINHTLLTCRFLQSENIPVAGVILNDTEGKRDAATRTNPQMLIRYLDVPLLGIYPHEPPGVAISREMLAETAAKYLDLKALL